ncbi:MAG: hypothetical protein ABIP48_33395, partial [Planctomycetota bacterium]
GAAEKQLPCPWLPLYRGGGVRGDGVDSPVLPHVFVRPGRSGSASVGRRGYDLLYVRKAHLCEMNAKGFLGACRRIT